MENILDELGIPKKYLKATEKPDQFIASVHKLWLKSLVKHSKLGEFSESGRLNDEELGPSWTKIFLRLYRKRDVKVIPLPRIRAFNQNEAPLLFAQLNQYVHQTNFKNLWKEAYKKFSARPETSKETQVTLMDYNDVLKEILTRIYGCPLINIYDSRLNVEASKQFEVHLNILPALCTVETLNGLFLIHAPFLEHNLGDCVNFSPALLEKCHTKPLFIVYQLLQTLKSLHDHSLTLGEISLNDIYLTEDMWIYIFPAISSNIYIQEAPPSVNDGGSAGGGKKLNNSLMKKHDCRKNGHNFDDLNLKCDYCGIRTYDKLQITGQSLDVLCQLWIDGQISNFTYISALNRLSGRKLGDPNCHYVFPWVTDFISRCGKNWRDLKKSKFRLNKGDRQLDLTYERSSQVPHHVSDVLSAITYYVYMARRTSRSVLCKHVRTVWVPAEYPSSIQRMQEWTPDECIPEFFTDPSVFRSIHEDLEDLEVPAWCSGPEDFIEKHREALESAHVSERLHHWIDLTFGYKLAGQAAVKAKNVCLHLVDDHLKLTKSGVVQLFTHPHPARAVPSIFWSKSPPKIYFTKPLKSRTRDRSTSPQAASEIRSDNDDAEDLTTNSARSPLGLSRFISRSRSSLNEEQSVKKPTPPNQRSASLGPKNPTFTSHVTPKTNQLTVGNPVSSSNNNNSNNNNNNNTIILPKEYKPEQALELLEKRHGFFSKTFHLEQAAHYKNLGETSGESSGANCGLLTTDDDSLIQNAFTNFIFAEGYERTTTAAIKSQIYLENQNNTLIYNYRSTNNVKNVSSSSNSGGSTGNHQIICNYSDIISARRIRELQILGCLIVEIFMAKQLRALGINDTNQNFNQRLKSCLTVIRGCQKQIPICIQYVINYLLQPNSIMVGGSNNVNFKYPAVSDTGLPPPSAHLLLEPLLHCLIPFPKLFPALYRLLAELKDFKNVAIELNILYHFDCNGEMCSEYENLERTKILFAQNIGECKVKSCVRSLDRLLDELNTTTDLEIVEILLPHIKDLLEDPPTAVLAAWYLFDSIARVLGPQKTIENLLESILKLYETEPNEATLPYNGKIAKLYHHSFLLRLIVRLGLKCFLDNFIAPLVEAVGRYKDYDRVDFILHNHSEKVSTRKTSHLKTLDDSVDISASDDSSVSSDRKLPMTATTTTTAEPEIFDFEEEKPDYNNDDDDDNNRLKDLIEHLELNVTADLPLNHSTAEEALDATVSENLEQLRSLEELKINLLDDEERSGALQLPSPTIPIPKSSVSGTDFSNIISCEVGSSSKKSDTESLGDRKSFSSESPGVDSGNSTTRKFSTTSHKVGNKLKRPDAKISDMSADSLLWLSHRLGPVLTARHLSRNLLKMLTLCYVGPENLVVIPREGTIDSITVVSNYVQGDQNALKVLECLTSIAGLYGEQLILFQYIPHMSELIALCKRKLTANLEGGLISCLALLKHIIPYLSDSTLMDQLQDVILKNILHPTVRLLGSTKYIFPSGSMARNILARKYIDTLYILSIRLGSDMTRTNLAVPALQRFFLIFDKIQQQQSGDEQNYPDDKLLSMEPDSHLTVDDSSCRYIELCRDGTTTEWSVGGRPLQISHVRLKDSESLSLSPPVLLPNSCGAESSSVLAQSLDELRSVFNSELAYTAYLPFLKHLGVNSLEISLKNHATIRNLCQEYEQEMRLSCPQMSKSSFQITEPSRTSLSTSGSIGSNIALIGNRIEFQNDNADNLNTDLLLSLVSNRMENNSRHLRGNWLAYWEHEIGRSDKDLMFNFKQIKLQQFHGHTHSVKCLYILDNENSFMSGSKDKTVKLWSLRSSGDGNNINTCQWTYTAHKKSVLSITFIESMRLVASCDSVVHIWDPFMGVNVGHLESPKYQPVNCLKSLPAPSNQFFAATTDGTVKIVDTRLCNYVYELKVSLGPTGLIRCLAVAPSGRWLAAGQSSGTITVLDCRTGLVISTWRAHESEVLQLIALDTDILVSSSLDQMISVWSALDGRFLYHMRGATEPVHCLNIYNNELISGTTANRIGVHTSIDLESSFSSTKLRSDAFKGILTSMAVLPLNRLLLLGADTGHINLLC